MASPVWPIPTVMRAEAFAKIMPKFTHHIFVCCNRRAPGHARGCCDPDATEALRNRFKAELKQCGLGPLVRANRSGCLDQCERGPTVVIYPQAIWYGQVQPEDVRSIIEETIIAGRVISRLRIPDHLLNTKAGRKVDAPTHADSIGEKG